MSGMHSTGPWLTLNDMPGLNATNTLYVVEFSDELTRSDRYALALGMLTSSARKQLARSTRRYADGLSKVEPGAMKALRLPDVKLCKDAPKHYPKALAALLSGDHVEARRIADRSFS